MQLTHRSMPINSLTVGRECPKDASMDLTSRGRNKPAGFQSTVICALTGESPGHYGNTYRKKETFKLLKEILSA